MANALAHLLTRIDRVPFVKVVWIVPIVLLLHEAEEWNIMGWFEAFFVERPASALSVRIWLVVVTLDIALVTWACTRCRRESTVAFLMLPIVAMVGANGLEHLFWLVHFEAYAPGVIFGGFVGVPVALYLVRRAVAGGLVPGWYAMLLGAYALVTLLLAVRAGNTLPPLIRLITAFSDRAAALATAWLA